ncbi:MAG: hypothetical protein K2L26_02470 [Duncaniella sp.]|nr:hypothetical protein [Duncaniella sp.]
MKVVPEALVAVKAYLIFKELFLYPVPKPTCKKEDTDPNRQGHKYEECEKAGTGTAHYYEYKDEPEDNATHCSNDLLSKVNQMP